MSGLWKECVGHWKCATFFFKPVPKNSFCFHELLYNQCELRSRCQQKYVYVFIQNVRYCCQVPTQTGTWENAFEKVDSIKFHTNFLQGYRDVTLGQTDTQTEDRNLHSHSCENFRFHNDGGSSACPLEVKYGLQKARKTRLRRRFRLSESIKQRSTRPGALSAIKCKEVLSAVPVGDDQPTQIYRDISWKYFTRRFLSSDIYI
jgi:hypothetical protein